MVKSNTSFELQKLFRFDVADLLAAREKARVLHASHDIDAAGDEVEVCARKIIRRRLPADYYVGHGQVIDAAWQQAGQFDIVVADKELAPVLFTAEGGTEYFCYEAVYAVGEVKSGYYGAASIETFIKKLQQLKRGLTREQAPNNYFRTRGRGMSMLGSSSDKRPFKNPLFSFMLFVASPSFDADAIVEIYRKYPIELLPALLCFLDRGVLGFGLYDSSKGYLCLHEMPEFAKSYERDNQFSHWTWLRNDCPESLAPSTFAWLCTLLRTHLNNCMLMPPDLQQYHSGVLFQGEPKWQPLLTEAEVAASDRVR